MIGAGQRRVEDLEQREPVAVGRGAENADHQRDRDGRDPEAGPGGPAGQRDDRPQQVPGLHHREQQDRRPQRDAEATDRMQPAAQHRQQQPGDQHRDEQHADRAGQRQHGGGVVAQAQQNADLAGAQRQQRGRRHPTAHDVGGAQGEQPAEAQAAGPADDRHDRQRQHAQPTAGQRETPSRCAPQRRASAIATNPSASSDGSFTCDDRVISTAPSSNIPSGPQADHSARFCGHCTGRGTSRRWNRCRAARIRCRPASGRASAPRCGCRRPGA